MIHNFNQTLTKRDVYSESATLGRGCGYNRPQTKLNSSKMGSSNAGSRMNHTLYAFRWSLFWKWYFESVFIENCVQHLVGWAVETFTLLIESMLFPRFLKIPRRVQIDIKSHPAKCQRVSVPHTHTYTRPSVRATLTEFAHLLKIERERSHAPHTHYTHTHRWIALVWSWNQWVCENDKELAKIETHSEM